MGRKKKPIQSWTVEDHRDYLLTGYSDEELNFRIFPRRLIACPAFLALGSSATRILLLMVNQVYWTDSKVDKRHNSRSEYIPGRPKPFKMPYNRLVACGLARTTIARGIRELLLLGFIKIKKQVFGKSTIYELDTKYQILSSEDVSKITGSKPLLV